MANDPVRKATCPRNSRRDDPVNEVHISDLPETSIMPEDAVVPVDSKKEQTTYRMTPEQLTNGLLVYIKELYNDAHIIASRNPATIPYGGILPVKSYFSTRNLKDGSDTYPTVAPVTDANLTISLLKPKSSVSFGVIHLEYLIYNQNTAAPAVDDIVYFYLSSENGDLWYIDNNRTTKEFVCKIIAVTILDAAHCNLLLQILNPVDYSVSVSTYTAEKVVGNAIRIEPVLGLDNKTAYCLGGEVNGAYIFGSEEDASSYLLENKTYNEDFGFIIYSYYYDINQFLTKNVFNSVNDQMEDPVYLISYNNVVEEFWDTEKHRYELTTPLWYCVYLKYDSKVAIEETHLFWEINENLNEYRETAIGKRSELQTNNKLIVPAINELLYLVYAANPVKYLSKFPTETFVKIPGTSEQIGNYTASLYGVRLISPLLTITNYIDWTSNSVSIQSSSKNTKQLLADTVHSVGTVKENTTTKLNGFNCFFGGEDGQTLLGNSFVWSAVDDNNIKIRYVVNDMTAGNYIVRINAFFWVIGG